MEDTAPRSLIILFLLVIGTIGSMVKYIGTIRNQNAIIENRKKIEMPTLHDCLGAPDMTDEMAIKKMTQSEKNKYYQHGKDGSLWMGLFLANIACILFFIGLVFLVLQNPLTFVLIPISLWIFISACGCIYRGLA